MLFNFDYDTPDGSIFFDEMPIIYRKECEAMYVVGEAGLLGNDPPVQITADVGWILHFGGYKLKVDQRPTGYHLAGV